MRLRSLPIPHLMQSRTGRPSLIDTVIYLLLASYGLLSLLALALVPLRYLPAEDAVILFQYSRNLAEHGAITFLANGIHVEGATDFAWMVLLAFGLRLHIPEFWFCAGVNASALIALAALLLKLANKQLSLIRLLVVMGAISLVPQFIAACSGFAVLVDAVLLTSLALAVAKKRVVEAALTALVFCLFRPDGVIFAVPLLFSMMISPQSKVKNTRWIVGLFLLPGLIYFVWRWRYFGEILPLPFLVKADTHRAFGLFVPRSIHQSASYLFFAGALLLPVAAKPNRRSLWFLIPLVGLPTLFYWGMRLDQNVAARFFYYLPLSAAILIALNWPNLGSRKSLVFRTGAAVWCVLLAMPLIREVRTFRDEQFRNIKDIATQLSYLPQKGSILTTEAGYLTYYSNWTVIDAWGLNTPEFAHRFITPQDVELLRPDLVVVHPDIDDSCVASRSWQASYPGRTWSHMTRNLVLGSDPNLYQLWLVSYGSDFYRQRKGWHYGEGDRECWFVNRAAPTYRAIVGILETHHGVRSNAAHRLALEHEHLVH